MNKKYYIVLILYQRWKLAHYSSRHKASNIDVKVYNPDVKGERNHMVNNFDELFEKNKLIEKIEKNEKLDKNKLDEIKNFSFELKPKPTSEEDLLLKEFLDGLNNYLTMEMLNFHSPKEIEDLRHLYKIRENLWNEVEKRWKK